MSYVEDFNTCWDAIKDNMAETEEVIDAAVPFMRAVGGVETEKLVRSLYRAECGRIFENANEAYMLLKPVVLDRISAMTMEWIFLGREVGKGTHPLVMAATQNKKWTDLCTNDELREAVRLSVQELTVMETMMLQNRVNAVLAWKLEEMYGELHLLHISEEYTHKVWDLFQMFYEQIAMAMFAVGVKMGEKSLINDEFNSLMDNLIQGSGKLQDPTEEEE